MHQITHQTEEPHSPLSSLSRQTRSNTTIRPRGRVFIIDDDELIVSMLSRALEGVGHKVRVETHPDGIIEKINSWSADVVLLDVTLPERSGLDILREIKEQETKAQVVMLTADVTAQTAVKAMKIGAADYLTKPFDMDEVKIVIDNILEKARLQQEVVYLRKVTEEYLDKDIVGDSGFIAKMRATLQKIAQARVPTILVTGESGTGKELVARHVHRLMHGDETSGYAPFIGINCAALPESILESELFGYEKGAFTDAKSDKKGLFELAAGGSLLLDEIGEMKQHLQSKLLRVLEDRKVRRLGGKEEVDIDVTVIATTNKDLFEAKKRGEFRTDLYYRLNAFFVHILPLRERKEDIPVLARHFLSQFATRYNKKGLRGFSAEAERLLLAYDWPGNVRELKNVIERMVVLESAEEILPGHLPREITDGAASSGHASGDRFTLPEKGVSLEALQRDLIEQALERAKHNKRLAARLLHMSYDSLRYQIKKFGLE